MNSIQLKQSLREKREVIDTSHATRLHRAISWYISAETLEQDDDLSFVALWISFNSCYAVESESDQLGDRDSFRKFIDQLIELDSEKLIYNNLWGNYSNYVKALVNNQYVFAPFWNSQRAKNDLWLNAFDSSKKQAHYALANTDTALLMRIILDRLYVLRNQLMHGGATYKSRVNRSQVIDGRKFMIEIMPIIIRIMLENSDDDWGEIFYPVV